MKLRLLSLFSLTFSLVLAQTGLDHFHIGVVKTQDFKPKDVVFIQEASTTLVLPAFDEGMNGTVFLSAGMWMNTTACLIGHAEYNR